MSASYWLRDPFRGGCRYFSPWRNDFVRGYYPQNEFEAACQSWTASNLPGETFKTSDEAMDASDEAFYMEGFNPPGEDEEDPEEDWQAQAPEEDEAEESFSKVWDPREEAARVAGRVHYYYWS